jgi:hypothetical protein
MIRNVSFSEALAVLMNDGHATCNTTIDALNIYFQEEVYARYQPTYKHISLIDEAVISITTKAIEADEPHLRGLIRVRVSRESPNDHIANLEVTLDEVFHHLVTAQNGILQWH